MKQCHCRYIKIILIFCISLVGCNSVHSKTLGPGELQKYFKNTQELAKKNKGYPCYSTDFVNKEVLAWLIRADVKNISSYEYPPSWANRNEKDMLSITVRLQDDEKAVFTVDIKIIDKKIECYDVNRIFY